MALIATSPTTSCTYCYSLQCTTRIESVSSANKRSSVTSRNAKLTIGRNLAREIVLQVELNGVSGGRPAVASYSLIDCVIHGKNVAHGTGAIEIWNSKLVIQLSNCPPRKLNVFFKSLQAKLDIMRSERIQQDSANNRTSMPFARNKHLQGLPNLHTVLSPLSVAEIRKVRRLRGLADSPCGQCDSPSTPSRGPLSTPKTSHRQIVKPCESESFSYVKLTEEQRNVIRCVLQSTRNVFFTGGAGTGKSLVLRRIIELLPAGTTFVTAATGVAACQLGGVTLHSFAGIGVGRGSAEDCLRLALSKDNVVKQWKLCRHLIIDEISMIDADFFTKVEYVARHIRRDSRPFGGIKLTVTGDFLQLPPVSDKKKTASFCFESETWGRCIHQTIMLKCVHRQDDIQFIKILEAIRVGRCEDDVFNALTKTKINKFTTEGLVPTRLCTHSADAVAVNRQCLEEIKGIGKVFEAEDSQFIPDSLRNSVAKRIVLKVGTQVMLVKNIDLTRGLSNGSRGVITRFSKNGFPIVKFFSMNEEQEVTPVRFAVRIPGQDEPACRRQIPLQLAWAISIHKSQGLTLDAVEVSLERVFAEGQSYVALSRARSLSSLRVIAIDPAVIKANKKVIKFYEDIQQDASKDETDGSFVLSKRPRLSL